MKSAVLLLVAALLVSGTGPARAQFAGSNGLASSPASGPNISGAGTGLSAPSTISPSGAAAGANPNAMSGPTATQSIYPGVGIGSTGLPPVSVMPSSAALARQRAQQQQRPR